MDNDKSPQIIPFWSYQNFGMGEVSLNRCSGWWRGRAQYPLPCSRTKNMFSQEPNAIAFWNARGYPQTLTRFQTPTALYSRYDFCFICWCCPNSQSGVSWIWRILVLRYGPSEKSEWSGVSSPILCWREHEDTVLRKEDGQVNKLGLARDFWATTNDRRSENSA